jgi:hypothetical protein|nr:MAG TPA: hypothetical protein [Caudoviricetes sp.]
MMTKVIPIPKGDFDKLIEETSVYELKSFLKVIRDSYLKAISSVRLEDVMALFDGYTMKNQPDGNKLYTFQLARYSNSRGEYRLNFTVTYLADRNVINFGELFTTYMKKAIQPKFENVFSETKHFAVIEDLAARITTEHKRHLKAIAAAAKRKTYGDYGDI